VISLTANAAEADGPLLCVVDDARWADSESIGALAFWGRRLQADRIALIFGERGESLTASPIQDLATPEVEGLEQNAARRLLVSEARFELDRDVALASRDRFEGLWFRGDGVGLALDLDAREPSERFGEPPVAVSEQFHGCRDEHESHDGGVDEDGEGETEADEFEDS
jgi:hypothetical protein